MPAARITVLVLVALFVTLIPTTIGALLSAIGIAGMDRLVRFNVLAMSGRAVEAAGDVDTLLLDKTGTITLGNRQATQFLPLDGVSEQELAEAALAGLAGRRNAGRPLHRGAGAETNMASRTSRCQGTFVPFTAQTRLSGIDCARRLHPQRRGGCGAGLGRPVAVRRGADRHRRPHRQDRRHAAGGGAGQAAAGRHPSQRHRQGRHPRALRARCARWASAP